MKQVEPEKLIQDIKEIKRVPHNCVNELHSKYDTGLYWHQQDQPACVGTPKGSKMSLLKFLVTIIYLFYPVYSGAC